MTRTVATLAIAAVCWLGAASIARAQALDATADAEAQALFRRGVSLGEEDRWAEALELFRRSRELIERPNTIFNIGFALFRLGRFGAAIAAFDEYLAATEGETSERRDESARLRGEAVAGLAEITLHVSPAGAELFIDGEPAGAAEGGARRVTLDPGRHVLRATLAGHREASITISVLAAERGERSLSLEPAVPAVTTAEPIEDQPAEVVVDDGGDIAAEPWLWIVIGVVLAGGAAGAIAGGVIASESGPPPPYGGSSGVVLGALRF